MTREEAIKEAYGIPVNKKQHEALHILIPELRESEEDERRIDAICELLENTSAMHPNYSHRKLIIWLKSLRPQSRWKPSEEQMEALLWCTAHLGGADHRVLAELYEHLKKYSDGKN